MKNKLISLNESIDKIKSEMTIGLSGFSYMNPPMVFVREIIRRKIKNLTLVSGPTSGIETDMLIGAGCIKKVVTSCVAFEKIAGVAPMFKKAAEEDEIEVWECDECIWHIAIKAGIYDIPYILWKGGIGSSIPKLNKDIEEITLKGEKYLKVPQLKIDLSFLHCGYSDIDGNVQFPKNIFLGRLFCEQELAESSRDVVCSVEKIMAKEFIIANHERTVIKNASILELPFGSHPGASNGFYVPDLDHYREYVKYCKDGKFGNYLEKYVYKVPDHDSYLDLVGRKKLESLRLKNDRKA